MKKVFFSLVLVAIVAGSVFAQEKKAENQAIEQKAASKKHWASGEASIIGGGGRYEHMLNDQWSIGANIYSHMTYLFVDFWTDFGIDVSGRYYWWGKTFFVGAALGYHSITNSSSIIAGVGITPEIGWKIDLGKSGAWFMEPGVKIPIAIGQNSMTKKTEGGIAFMPYFGFGYAF